MAPFTGGSLDEERGDGLRALALRKPPPNAPPKRFSSVYTDVSRAPSKYRIQEGVSINLQQMRFDVVLCHLFMQTKGSLTLT